MSRAIKIFGIGFSADDSDAEIEVAVDGSVIYTGAVTTDTNFNLKEYLLGSDLGEEEVASWIEGDAATTKSLSIKALSGNFLYTETLTTYVGEENLENPELFGVQSYTEADGDEVSDPNSNILINGEIYEDLGRPDDRSELYGQWNIGIPEGSTLTCDLNIDEAPVKPEPETTDTTV
jgi:hypothetical protein